MCGTECNRKQSCTRYQQNRWENSSLLDSKQKSITLMKMPKHLHIMRVCDKFATTHPQVLTTNVIAVYKRTLELLLRTQ